MKITLLAQRYYPSFGGVETYLRNLSRALVDLGHTVTIVSGATKDDQPEIEEHEGATIHRFPATRSKIRCRAWFVRNVSLFRSADIIQVSNTLMLEYLRNMLAPFIDSSRVFLTRHGMSGKYPVPDTERQRAQRAQKWVAGIVHDGRFIERWLDVKPNLCPDQGLFPLADDITQQKEPPPNSAIFIGRLEPDTGISMYVDSIRILNESNRLPAKPFELHVYGNGSLKESLEERIGRERLPVIFHKPTPAARDQIPKHCFAFVDGRMAIVEAYARRRTVIAAYTNPWKKDYLCGETFSPYLIATDSPVAHAQRVLELINDPEQRQFRVNNAFKYARDLSWTATAEQFVNLWVSKCPKLATSKPSVTKKTNTTSAQRPKTSPEPELVEVGACHRD